MKQRITWSTIAVFVCVAAMIHGIDLVGQEVDSLEAANPIVPIPDPPLGIGTEKDMPAKLTEFENPPTPERVRLGRWLFFDKRLSADDSIACATCHRPENAFSEPTPVSTGIGGQQGGRKAPTIVNLAWSPLPHFFWDGRASSLEDQAGGPMTNPIEMGNENHDFVISKIKSIKGYGKYFEECFGTKEVTLDRVTKAIADYERTRMSGNSPWDKWRAGDRDAVSASVKRGHRLFFGNAFCNNCHLGQNFTDSKFHNLGVGWDPEKKEFSDVGRYAVTEVEADKGAFKTPSLRDLSKRGPYMHDGSMKTLREVVEFYSKGGEPNPHLDRKIDRRFAEQLDFSEQQITDLIAFMESLNGEGYEDTPPAKFPQ